MTTQPRIAIDRRTAIKWVIAASAALGAPMPLFDAFAAGTSTGYGKDPELMKLYKPGEVWPLVLTPEQRRIAQRLSDIIIPREGETPAASEVGAVEFIDEWISSPYEAFGKDRPLIVGGLTWIDKEGQRRFNQPFAALTDAQIHAICDDISETQDAATTASEGSEFFARFRTLAAVAYFTTPVGMKDLGYVGNVPLKDFPGPPVDVLKKVGLV